MSHAFIPPDIPGHENTPFVLQLVANSVVERIVVVNNENLLHPKKEDFLSFIQNKYLAYEWQKSEGLIELVGVLSMTNRWLYFALRDVVDVILAVSQMVGWKRPKYVTGKLHFTTPCILEMEKLHDILKQTKVASVTPLYSCGQIHMLKYDFHSVREDSLQWQVERLTDATLPGVVVYHKTYRDEMVTNIRSDLRKKSSFTWEEFDEIFKKKGQGRYKQWHQGHNPYCRCYEPSTYFVETIGKTVRLNDFVDLHNVLVARGYTVTYFSVESREHGIPVLQGKIKRCRT